MKLRHKNNIRHTLRLLQKIDIRHTLGVLAGITFFGGVLSTLGAGLAGLAAGSEEHKDQASRLALISTGICVIGFAGGVVLFSINSENEK